MGDGVPVVVKHAQEDKKCADHHSCATFASLAMDDNYWLFTLTVGAVHSFPCHLVVLLHSRQEQACVKAELEDFLQVGHVMIWEREPTDTELLDGLL